MDKPAAVYLPPNYDVRVLADKVKIIGNRGSLTLPGASLQIVARKLECDFPGCVIDLSGADAPTDATSKQANSGAQQGWPGAGSAGTDGACQGPGTCTALGRSTWTGFETGSPGCCLQGSTARTAARVAS